MKKLYYLLIFLIPIVIVLISFALIETVTSVIPIPPNKVVIEYDNKEREDGYAIVSNMNKTLQLFAKVEPAKVANETVTWYSSNPTYATVQGGVQGKVNIGNVIINHVEMEFDTQGQLIEKSVDIIAYAENGVSSKSNFSRALNVGSFVSMLISIIVIIVSYQKNSAIALLIALGLVTILAAQSTYRLFNRINKKFEKAELT